MSQDKQEPAIQENGGFPSFPSGGPEDSFFGVQIMALDQKGRVRLPDNVRSVLNHPRYGGSRRFYVNTARRGRFTAVFLYPEVEWKRRLAESGAGGRLSPKVLSELTYGGEFVTLDSAERLLLTDHQIRTAQLTPRARVAVVGVLDHIEVWDEPRYNFSKEEGLLE